METAKENQKVELKKFEDKPTAIVAGGAGFLGSYLCESLIAQNFNVICIDNLARSSKQNIEKLLSFSNFFFWEEDINKPGFTISPTVKVTHVFHLASVEEYLSANKLSLQTLLVNSFGTKNLLDIALQKEAKFIFVSSSEVFRGAFSQTTLSNYFGNETATTHLTFGEAKRFSETMAAEYFKNFNLPVVIVRIKDPYGPKMNLETDNIVASVLSQGLKGKIEVIGDGLKTANPTYVTDIIFGIVKAAIKGESGEIINLINQERFTERAIAEHLKKLLGNLEIVYKEQKQLEMPEPPLIFNQAEKLGWSPKVSLDEGLLQTINYYKDIKEGKSEETIVAHKPTVPIVEVRVNKPGGRKSLLNIVLIALGALLLWTTAFPLVNSALSYYLGNKNLSEGLSALEKDNSDTAASHAQTAENLYKNSQESLQNISWLLNALNLKEATKQTNNYLFFAETISRVANYDSKSKSEIKKASGNSSDLSRDLTKASDSITEAYKNLEIASTIAIETKRLPPFFRDDYKNLQEKEKTLEKLTETISTNLESNP
jgi:nucleoside-diphosphate-sugar epimerase